MPKRKWKRWVVAYCKPSLKELVDIARNNGMKCIKAFKMSMFTHFQIGLYGTSDQMRATEKRWLADKVEFTNREPTHAFAINVDIPVQKWVDYKPKRIQRKRTKGWKKPEGAVYVGRGSKWGNPFIVGCWYHKDEGKLTPEMSIKKYREWVKAQIFSTMLDIAELRGKDLMCWCAEDAVCHGDILLEIANS